ncbi:CoA pyrophosphatase [Flavicella sp.]|uniref:NUDIX hydrolase n=1 Tax=Flavicella sp. TaxID=2957742 RepID=UPI00301AD64C
MLHQNFLNLSNSIKKTVLGGEMDHYKMAPDERKKTLKKEPNSKQPKKAAVLALFYPNLIGETCFALTLRPVYKGTHSAQVSFPGGKQEPNDSNLSETALRETFEEIGINKSEIKLLREITDVYIPPSNFLVTPFIGITENPPVFKQNHEVHQMIEVTLTELLDDSLIHVNTKKTFYAEKASIPYYYFSNHMVWGATAMIISEIKELIKRL